MRDKQRTEDRIFAIIDDQQKMQVVGHDHEIAYRRRRPNAMDSPQGELNDFTEPRQLRPRLLAEHPREHLSPLGDNERDEEKLPSGMAERQLHLLTISAMKTKSSLPWELSTPWPEPSGVQVESPGLIVRFTPLSS